MIITSRTQIKGIPDELKVINSVITVAVPVPHSVTVCRCQFTYWMKEFTRLRDSENDATNRYYYDMGLATIKRAAECNASLLSAFSAFSTEGNPVVIFRFEFNEGRDLCKFLETVNNVIVVTL